MYPITTVCSCNAQENQAMLKATEDIKLVLHFTHHRITFFAMQYFFPYRYPGHKSSIDETMNNNLGRSGAIERRARDGKRLREIKKTRLLEAFSGCQ